MRKSTPRHWLHACLDLLPVLLIPVFMIYSHRHNIDSGSIQIQEKISVDFNQIKQNGNMLSTSTYYASNGLLSVRSNILHFVADDNQPQWFQSGISFNLTNLKPNHIYQARFELNTDSTSNLLFIVQSLNNGGNYNLGTSTGNIRFTNNSNNTQNSNSIVAYPNVLTNGQYLDLQNFNIFDLTQMFGSGNEPSIDEFNTMFPDLYYEYNLSQKMFVDSPTLTTYDDTDIMSQFTYQLYNSVDKYFNMNNIFGMNNVYQWFELNIFGGTAPIYIYIVWNIILYEFVMDLLFLLYGLFMWFIDMLKALIEKPIRSIK